MPIRVLHLIASNFVGGPEKQILHHARQLQGSEFEIWIGSFREHGEIPAIIRAAIELGIPHVVIDGKLSDFSILHALKDALVQNRIDLLCSHHYKATILGYYASRQVLIPQIAFVRGWTSEGLKVGLYTAAERRILRRVDHVVCVSAKLSEEVVRGEGRPAPRVIHNAPVDAVAPRCTEEKRAKRIRLGIPEEDFLILVAGRLSTEKGHSVLLNSLAQVRDRIPHLAVKIFGDGPKREEVLQFVNRLALGGVVELKGFTPDLDSWMRAADLVVNPSLSEGVPNVLLEAAACGVPIVATAVGGVPEVFNESSARLIPAADPDALAEAIVAAYHHPADREMRATHAAEQLRHASAVQEQALSQTYTEALTRIPRGTWRQRSELPCVAVVIPVLNESHAITRVLSALECQEYPSDRLEIVVADGGSTDDTLAHVQTFAGGSRVKVRSISNPLRRSGPGRSVGVRATSSDVVIFVDGHCQIPSQNMIASAVRLLRDYQVVVISRPQPLTTIGNSRLQQIIAECRAHFIGHGSDSTIFDTRERFVHPASAGAIYDRTVFDAVGVFDDRFDACEDVEFNTRIALAGERAVTSPEVAVWYEPRRSISGLFKQLARYGEGRMRLLRKHPSVFTWTQILPAVFVLWLLAGVFVVRPSPFRTVWLVSIAAYAGIILYSTISLMFQRGITRILAAPVFFTIHIALGFGFCREFLRALFGRGPSFAASTGADSKVRGPVS